MSATSRRERAAALLTQRPLGRVLGRLPVWPGVLVLNYHRIGDSVGQPWDRALWSAGAKEFDAQLRTLRAHAEVIAPDELVGALRMRRGRRVLLTFDDGYRDNYEIAFPLLRSHGLRASFFLATGFLDAPRVAWWDEIAWMVNHARTPNPDRDATIATLTARYKTLPDGAGEGFLEELAHSAGSGRCPADAARELWMSWGMAREMHAAGMAIGGHTVSHPVLARLTPERQREEIGACARRLREELPGAMRWFAYPVGSRDTFTRETQAILRDSDVELAFSFYGGYARASGWNPLDVPRIHVGPGFSTRLLQATVALPRIFAR